MYQRSILFLLSTILSLCPFLLSFPSLSSSQTSVCFLQGMTLRSSSMPLQRIRSFPEASLPLSSIQIQLQFVSFATPHILLSFPPVCAHRQYPSESNNLRHKPSTPARASSASIRARPANTGRRHIQHRRKTDSIKHSRSDQPENACNRPSRPSHRGLRFRASPSAPSFHLRPEQSASRSYARSTATTIN